MVADTAFFAPFQLLPMPVHSIGPDALLLMVNDAWVEFTGYDRGQALGRSFADFLDPDSARRYREKSVPELISRVGAHERRAVEYRFIRADGEVADIVVTSRPARDAAGGFRHSLAVITDVTARNRAEAALRHTQKLEALGNLTSGVAHDFNNLLTVILSSLQLLGNRLPPGDARAARLVQAAMEGARRGAALTARLLAFARQQELAPRPLDPSRLLAAMQPMLVHLLGPAVGITVETGPDLWTLRADRDQLELALLNLAANARDAMPDGGRLVLGAHNARARGQGGQPPGGDFVVLTVRDTGVGMTEAVLSRAADPFFTTKTAARSTGLGLSMVHGFASQSGGALVLRSRPGEGTEVELWLPRTTEPAAPADPAPELALPRGLAADGAGGTSSLRILLVDDDPLVRAGTAGMLDELGHACLAVASGEAALEVLAQQDGFDLLLTDHLMPGLSGMQVAARARALYPAMPVLVASGFAELGEVQAAGWPRLRKPYTLADLAAALQSVTQPDRALGRSPPDQSMTQPA